MISFLMSFTACVNSFGFVPHRSCVFLRSQGDLILSAERAERTRAQPLVCLFCRSGAGRIYRPWVGDGFEYQADHCGQVFVKHQKILSLVQQVVFVRFRSNKSVGNLRYFVLLRNSVPLYVFLWFQS